MPTSKEAPSSFRTQAPAPAAPRPFHFPQITRLILPNGLKLLIAEKGNAPLVSVQLTVKSGADSDPAGKPGLASLTADMLDEGAGGRSVIEIAEQLGTLGASLASGADWDASYVALDVLSRNLEQALAIFADVVLRPSFRSEDLERVRRERVTTILQQKDEPSIIAAERFSQFVFAETPYGNPLIGTEESIAGMTRDDVQSFYRAHFHPENSVLIITGDVKIDDARQLAEKCLGRWEVAKGVVRRPMKPRPIEQSRIFIVDRPHAVQSEIRIGHVGVDRATEDYFSLIVMNSILGGIFTSRLNLNLRERHGYTYHVRSNFGFRRHAGPFVVGTAVRNEVTKESVEEIISEMRHMRDGEVQQNELDEARNYLMGVFPATVQTASDLAGRLQEMELYGLPEDYFDNYRQKIGAVDAAAVTEVARKYLNPDKVAIVIVGKVDDIRPSLVPLGAPIEVFDIDGRVMAS